MPLYVGLDLGQGADYTALAIIHSVHTRTPDGETVKGLHLRHLRWGTTYGGSSSHIRVSARHFESLTASYRNTNAHVR
jgi:hypothetical protein